MASIVESTTAGAGIARTAGDATPRQPLSRERIAAAALERVDAGGLAALSMRKLGTDLGVEAMSLYNHVRNKDDLYAAIGDLLHDHILAAYAPLPEASWQDKARAMAVAWWTIGRAHPNAFVLLVDKPAQGPSGVSMLATCMKLFTDAGFSLENAVAAFQAAASWLVGRVTQEIGLMQSLAMGEGFTDADVPAELHALLDFKRICVGTEPDVRFETGLEIVIAGIEARLAP